MKFRCVGLDFTYILLASNLTAFLKQYHPGNSNARKFSRVQTERVKSQSIASSERPFHSEPLYCCERFELC
jgi:hypothetical protein